MDINFGLIAAGLVVGLLVGLTGMGAGSLMTPILISVFGIPATTAVGTDLVYAAVTKTFGAARHHTLNNVNRELALWMGDGQRASRLPRACTACITCFNGDVNYLAAEVIGYTLVLVGHRRRDPHVRLGPRPVGCGASCPRTAS